MKHTTVFTLLFAPINSHTNGLWGHHNGFFLPVSSENSLQEGGSHMMAQALQHFSSFLSNSLKSARLPPAELPSPPTSWKKSSSTKRQEGKQAQSRRPAAWCTPRRWCGRDVWPGRGWEAGQRRERCSTFHLLHLCLTLQTNLRISHGLMRHAPFLICFLRLERAALRDLLSFSQLQQITFSSYYYSFWCSSKQILLFMKMFCPALSDKYCFVIRLAQLYSLMFL